MPGQMDDNLRRGSNTENLGLHLLRAVGAVAPVPRDQDVGIDAILTLLERDQGRRLVSGSSVFVQLKSSSIRRIIFTPSDLEWLHQLELPYFIGSVDASDASIALYTVHEATRLFGTKSVTAELCLDLAPECINPPTNTGPASEDWVTDNRDKTVQTKVYLAPPILAWTITDSQDREFLNSANEVLESWVTVSNENRLLHAMGESLTVSWKTGEKPEQSGSMSTYHAGDNTCNPAVRLFNMALKRVSMEAAIHGDVEALKSLLQVTSHLKQHGVEDSHVVAAGVVAKLRSKSR